jgi:hypothetical protein
MPRLEALNLLILDDARLFEHAALLGRELWTQRCVVSVAIERVNQLTHELRLSREQLARVNDEYRALRAQVTQKAIAA